MSRFVGVRVPDEIAEPLEKRAEKAHSGNLSAAVIAILEREFEIVRKPANGATPAPSSEPAIHPAEIERCRIEGHPKKGRYTEGKTWYCGRCKRPVR